MIYATIEGQVMGVGSNPNKKDPSNPYPFFKVLTDCGNGVELAQIDGNGYKKGDMFNSICSIQNGDYGLRIKEVARVKSK